MSASVRAMAVLSAAAIVGGFIPGGRARAETSANVDSPLGINLTGVTYYTPEQPFLNIFKTTGVSKATPKGWFTYSRSKMDTGEEAYLQLDADGYPTTLQASSADPHQQFSAVGVLILRGLPNSNAGTGLPYRPGQYVVLYDGNGTLSYGFDATLVSHSQGRDVINIARPTTGGGVLLLITATDPNNHLRNIRVVKAEEEGLLSQGDLFAPQFLAMLKNFHVIRFMQWSKIDEPGGMVGAWSNRTHSTDAGWGTVDGVPLEVDIQLANAVGADAWLNVPVNADADYITQMATLAHNTLSPSLKVYIEFSNEVWNSAYAQYNYAIQQGKATWPGAGVSAYTYNRDWFGMRTAQMCDIWKSVWGGDGSRVICVLGAQAANTWTATEALNCPLWKGTGNAPCAAHGIDAVAIAPYFADFQAPAAWTSTSDGGLTNLFQELNQAALIHSSYAGADLAKISSWEAAYKAALAPYKLPFIAYEGGQTLVGFPQSNGSPVVKLYIQANRDPRMGATYTNALQQWKANGGQTYVIFNDVNAPSQYGEWGALESFMDTTKPLSSSPPKWQAIQNFISATPCWWQGCRGAVSGDVPQSPKNFQANH
ncbi:MAG TPA: hypothetical protein VFA39_12915 [Steroidobacteraceae bacterium]|nr:hypothetical protein [Steroidobacteraceae bacterium]